MNKLKLTCDIAFTQQIIEYVDKNLFKNKQGKLRMIKYLLLFIFYKRVIIL